MRGLVDYKPKTNLSAKIPPSARLDSAIVRLAWDDLMTAAASGWGR
jgi:hypothetical protein